MPRPDAAPETPRLAGPWRPLYSPSKHGNYVNDHSVVRAADGSWHLFGITGFESNPSQERYFTHGTAATLTGPDGMREAGKVIDDGTRAWAPCVVEHDGVHHIFYGPSPTRRAVTRDLASNEWWDHPVELVGAPPFAAHRDHMVIRINDYTWAMYVTGVHEGRSAISVFVSNDLSQWRFVQFALTSAEGTPLNPAWGAFESPYLVRRGGLHYLFTTYTDCSPENYHQTLVFASANPFDFGTYTGDHRADGVVAELHAHAGEVLHDTDTDTWYLTSAGWRGNATVVEGGVGIAELTWDD